jgi:hypothetical protein
MFRFIVDKSAGRVQILEGDLYYSPNSTKTVQLPAPHREGSNPFSASCLPDGKRSLWQIDTSVFDQPQWWGDHYGWIAFYNHDILDTSSILFRSLRNSAAQYTFKEGIGYTLSQLQADELLRLENQLNCVYVTLRSQYKLLGLPPSKPWAFGYLRPHSKRGILSLCMEKTRNWFKVWLCLMSYMIAAAESHEVLSVEHPILARQNWRNQLATKCADVQIDQAWLDLLSDTAVASFSPHTSRTGTFVSLTPGAVRAHENTFQPAIEWFIEYGVPVWYRWNKDTASLANIQHLAPPESQLQNVDSFIRKSPPLSTAPIQASPIVASVDDDPYRRETHFSTAKMDAFLKLRDERTARLKEQQTPQQRALRLSREAQPPTLKTRVFEWTADGEGEFVCEELKTKALRRQALEHYTGDQLRYNAVLNEWHVCEVWGDFGSDLDDDFFCPTFEDDDPQVPFSPSRMQSHGDDNLADDVWTPTRTDLEQTEPENRRALQLEQEIIQVATTYFGYTPCVPLPAVKLLEGEQQRKRFCRSFGLIWKQVEPLQYVFTHPAVAAAVDFFQRLAKNDAILPDEWDLDKANQQSVVHYPRFKFFRPVLSTSPAGKHSSANPILYMLDLGLKNIAPWKLAVKSASDALMICRLSPDFNEYNIVDFLLTNGIAFHTLQPSRTVVRTPNISRPSLTPLTRSEGYKFGSNDYLAFREHCHAVLNHPRGRAALMHGHFMWRIAFHSVMWEAVYSGPSGWSTDPDEMLTVRDSDGVEFIDDKLSTAEQEVLCGTYHCLTGKFTYPGFARQTNFIVR